MSTPAQTADEGPRQPTADGDAADLRFRQLFDHLDAAALVLDAARDAHGRVTGLTLVEANPAGRQAFGPDYALAVGRPASEVFGDPAVRPLLAVAARLLAGELDATEVAFATRNRWFTGIAFAIDARTLVALESEHALPGAEARE